MSDTPPWDLIFPLAYCIVIPFSMYVNSVPAFPLRSWIWALVLVLRVQMLTELLDITSDSRAARPTSLVLLGPQIGTALVSSMILLELQIVARFFDNNYWLIGFEIFTLLQVVCAANRAPVLLVHVATILSGFAFVGSCVHGF